MQFRPTSYEVVATHNGAETRLSFTERRTKSVLLRIAQANNETVLAMLGDWDGEATYTKDHGWTFGPCRIHYTGRTERDLAGV
jgi:hypothetical protein